MTTTSLTPQLDLTWIDDDEYVSALEMMVRKGMTVDQCATILKVQSSAVAVVMQRNPKIRRAALEATDRVRHTVTRHAVDRSMEVLGHLMEIVATEADEDGLVKTANRIAAANLYLQAAGVVGGKALESEKRVYLDPNELTEGDQQTRMILNILIDRAKE